jgi:hypothetical protein
MERVGLTVGVKVGDDHKIRLKEEGNDFDLKLDKAQRNKEQTLTLPHGQGGELWGQRA